ncbi:MAG TPA: hypothetical protein VM537_01070, partial [Anaerolineae bacterium]|nr:hypothetical protein [Anaerolineae bacterium]
MAKRQSEVVVRSVPNVSLRWEMWADPVVKGGVGAIEGVRVLAQSSTGWVPLEFDPRYRPTDLITEIKALADGKEPQGDTLESLKAEAQDLGNRVDRAGLWSTIGMEYVRAAVAGRSYQNRAWLHSMHREIGEILSGEPQPEQSLAEAA